MITNLACLIHPAAHDGILHHHLVIFAPSFASCRQSAAVALGCAGKTSGSDGGEMPTEDPPKIQVESLRIK